MRAEIAGCFFRAPVRAVRTTGGAGGASGTSVTVVLSSGSLIISRRPRPRRAHVLFRHLAHVLSCRRDHRRDRRRHHRLSK